MNVMRKFRTAGLGLAVAAAMTASAVAEEIHVAHWGELLSGAPYAVAMSRGYFKEAGADIDTVISSKGGGTTVRNLLAGGLPFGEVSAAGAIEAIQAGLPVKIVGSAVNTLGDVMWVVMPDSKLRDLNDLRGHKMAISSVGSTTDMLSALMLEGRGIPLDEVERPAVGGFSAGLAALENGSVDAAVMIEPLWSERSQRYRMLVRVSDELPPMSQSVVIASDELIAEQPKLVAALIAARDRAVADIYADPDKAAEDILAYYPNLTPDVAQKAMRNMAGIGYWATGAVDAKALGAMLSGLQKVGRAEGGIDLDPMIANPADGAGW